jgi:hypothetical protein
MEVYSRGGNNALYVRWQTATCGDWSRWASLGGISISYPVWRDKYPSDLRVKIVVCGTDHREWYRLRTGTGSWGPWQGPSVHCGF